MAFSCQTLNLESFEWQTDRLFNPSSLETSFLCCFNVYQRLSQWTTSESSSFPPMQDLGSQHQCSACMEVTCSLGRGVTGCPWHPVWGSEHSLLKHPPPVPAAVILQQHSVWALPASPLFPSGRKWACWLFRASDWPTWAWTQTLHPTQTARCDSTPAPRAAHQGDISTSIPVSINITDFKLKIMHGNTWIVSSLSPYDHFPSIFVLA